MDPFVIGKVCRERTLGQRISKRAEQEAYNFLTDMDNQFIVTIIKTTSKFEQYERLKLYGRTAFKNNQVRFMVGFFGYDENLPSMRRDAAWEILIQVMLKRAYAERFYQEIGK